MLNQCSDQLMSKNKNIYFPGLTGLRFFAAFAVVFSHIELYKHRAGIDSLHHLNIYQHLGNQGVKIFFVLSGFLITYLLLAEKEQFKKINVKNFYIRRILRIWPVYFLVIALSFFVFPLFIDSPFFSESILESKWIKFGLMLFILPNIVRYVFGPMLGINVLWSIGAEEQFYLIWPHLVNKFKSSLKYILISILSLIVLTKGALILLESNLFNLSDSLIEKTHLIYLLLDFDCMAIGALLAYFLFHQNKFLEYFKLISVQTITALSLLALVILKPELSFVNNLIYGCIYAIVILNAAANSKSIFTISSKLTDFLGLISYGVYIYHTLVMVLIFELIKDSNLTSIEFNLIFYISSILLTIIVASLSYFYFEKPILKFKRKFMLVKSGKI